MQLIYPHHSHRLTPNAARTFIEDAAERCEQSNAPPVPRITLAKRIASPELTDVEWSRLGVGEAINLLLDGAVARAKALEVELGTPLLP